MCLICYDCVTSMSSAVDVLLPLITRVRQLYKKCFLNQNGKREDRGNEGSPADVCHSKSVVMQFSPIYRSIECLQENSSVCGCDDSSSIIPENCFTPLYSSQNQSRGGTPPFHLQKDGIRVLLFRECDSRGRKLLYDSKTVVQVPITESSSNVSSCKTLFKSSRTSGSSFTSLTSGGASSAAQQCQVATNKIPSCNFKSAASSSSKSDVFAEISGGYGYQVSSVIC